MSEPSAPEPLSVRRVVISEAADGKGVFSHVESVQSVRRPADRIVYPIWGLDGPLSLPVDVTKPLATGAFPPAEGGYRVRVMQFLPDEATDAHHDARGAELGSRLREIDLETGLHASDSIDIGIVIDGEVTLVEDDGAEMTLGPLDVFVQNGTRHVWRNRSGRPCTIALVILAADRL